MGRLVLNVLLSFAQFEREIIAERTRDKMVAPGGRPFTKTSLYRLLTNVSYVGKVRYKDEIHQGEQPALVDTDTLQRVQTLLRSHM
jgi:DNA invertase Pin-like site-specific DNA recombinase